MWLAGAGPTPVLTSNPALILLKPPLSICRMLTG